MKWLKFFKAKRVRRILLAIVMVPILLFAVVVGVVYAKQDAIVQELLVKMNTDFVGAVELKDSHISLFENFPYISIDFEETKVYESKDLKSNPILDVHDIYVGFDLWSVINGQMQIKRIKLKDGVIRLVQHVDGGFNIVKALASVKPVESTAEEFHLDLSRIELENVDISKLNEANNVLVDLMVEEAVSKFKTADGHVYASLFAKFESNLVLNGDTSYVKHKHFVIDTELDYVGSEEVLVIQPSTIKLEDSFFNAKGKLDFNDDLYIDLDFEGNKPNFDLFIAMAPEELIPTLKKYENAGKIFFEVGIHGKSINGHTPAINARFGCEQAYINNFKVNKQINDLNFVGYFTNGALQSPETMEFGIQNFSARPEAGLFSGNLSIKNFNSPDINLQLKSDFQLDFLAKFFELEDLSDLQGKVELTMNFRDIIDLEHPERSIEKLNESYFTQLKIDNLSFAKSNVNLPIKDIDLYAELNGHEARIDYFNVVVGSSDIQLSGTVSDLPAIIHHTDIPVTSKLKVSSKLLNLYELTGKDSLKSVNEQIENFSVDAEFTSSARAMTESPNLPMGEFFVKNLYAKMKNYPHTLHDFHADVFIEEEDFRVIDFKGMIDKSDFFFSGKLKHYDLWFQENPAGDTRVEFDWTSNVLQLHDVFSYNGENYVPEDYRNEEFDQLKFHGVADLHFNNGLRSIDLDLDHFGAKMKVHHQRLENFNGRIHYEDDHIMVQNFIGKIGTSDFKTSLNYYLGDDENIKKRDNHFELTSNRLNFDELFFQETKSTAAPANNGAAAVSEHDAGFNLYELPFTDMTFDIKIAHLNYHKYLIDRIDWKLRTTPNHYIYIEKAHLEAADGIWDLKGYFNGSNPKAIYFSPDINVQHVDLDKLLLKFDNFGQDHLVSENLHGKLSGKITGKIHMHKDLVPIIDDSEIHIDMEVLDGRLENYAMLEAMADYFADKNVKKVMFDTLTNHIDLTQGKLTIPKMSINSSLGFMEISGSQDLNMNMDYYVSVPWKMVTQAASSKLFGGKKKEEVDPEQVDEIQSADPNKRTRFVNIRIQGTPEDYKITMRKNRDK
jgi:hypothetical protein